MLIPLNLFLGKRKSKIVDVKLMLICGICNVFHPLSLVVFHKQANIWHLIYCFAWKTQMFSMKSLEQTEASLNNAQNWISPNYDIPLFWQSISFWVGFTTTTKKQKTGCSEDVGKEVTLYSDKPPFIHVPPSILHTNR